MPLGEGLTCVADMDSLTLGSPHTQGPTLEQTAVHLTRARSRTLPMMQAHMQPDGTCALTSLQIAAHLGLSKRTVDYDRATLQAAGDIAISAARGWLNRARNFVLNRQTATPGRAEIAQVTCANCTSASPATSRVSNSLTSSLENIENTDAAGAKAPPAAYALPFAQKQSNSQNPKPTAGPDLFAQFINWLYNQTGQMLERIQVGMIAKAAKEGGLTFWQFWQGLINGRHNLKAMRNLGGCLYRMAQRGLQRAWTQQTPQAEPAPPKPKRPQRESYAERVMQSYFSSGPQCPKCNGRRLQSDRKTLCECAIALGAR